MSAGIQFDEIKIHDNLIIDGHHRYFSSLIVGIDVVTVISQKTSATKLIEWNLVEFDENDWDTPSKIAHLNKLDALYNNLDLEIIKQIISR